MPHTLKQIFQPQQGADTFIEWIFVGNHAREGQGGSANCDGLMASLQISPFQPGYFIKDAA